MIKQLGIKILALCMALAACSTVVGFISIPSTVYKVVLIIALILGLFAKNKYIGSYWLIGFALIAALSLLFNYVPSVFNAWQRYIYFLLLLIVLSPIIRSCSIDLFRYLILKYSLQICVALSSISFVGYFWGINYMSYDPLHEIVSGTFAGVTKHSMLLGPIAGLSFIYLLANVTQRQKLLIKVIHLILMAMCLGSLLLSASRGAVVCSAFGAFYVLFRLYFKSLTSVIVVLSIFIVLIGTYSLWGNFADYLIEKNENNISSGSFFSSRMSKWNARYTEFENNPIIGIGFACVDTSLDEVNYQNGSIEPGSSWLYIMSSTGILGFFFLFFAFFEKFRFYLKRSSLDGIFLFAVYVFFILHLIVEGYLLFPGSYLCFLFWLIIGVINIDIDKYKYEKNTYFLFRTNAI